MTTAHLYTFTQNEELMARARWVCIPIVDRAPVDAVRRVAIKLAQQRWKGSTNGYPVASALNMRSLWARTSSL